MRLTTLGILLGLTLNLCWGYGSVEDSLHYLRSCNAEFLSVCGSELSFTHIAANHPVKVMNCLYSHSSSLSADCFAALAEHPFLECADDAVTLCPTHVVDPGTINPGMDNEGSGDGYWESDYYPFEDSAECMIQMLEHNEVSSISEECHVFLMSTAAYTCEADLENLCDHEESNAAVDYLACLVEDRKHASAECQASLEGYPDTFFGIEVGIREEFLAAYFGLREELPVLDDDSDQGNADESRRKVPVGTIVGSLVGVALGLGLVVGCVVYYRKKRGKGYVTDA